MSDYCDESYTLHRKAIRRARKAHVCCACKLPIRAGDFYAFVFTLYDGETHTYKRCGACEVTHQHLLALCDEQNDGYDFGGGMYPREDLGCGLAYEDEWGDVPEDIEALPFMSADERGSLLRPVSP